MHDIRAIRENPAAFDAALARRGYDDVLSMAVLAIDEARSVGYPFVGAGSSGVEWPQ